MEEVLLQNQTWQVTLRESAIRPAGDRDIDDKSKNIILLHEDDPHFFWIVGEIDVGVLEKMFPDAQGLYLF